MQKVRGRVSLWWNYRRTEFGISDAVRYLTSKKIDNGNLED